VLREGELVELVASFRERAALAADWLAKTPLAGLTLREVGSRGLEVAGVKPGSIAERRGFRAGDVILGVNRNPVDRIDDLRRIVPDGRATLLVDMLREVQQMLLIVEG